MLINFEPRRSYVTQNCRGIYSFSVSYSLVVYYLI